jgi:tyrosyl-tRNA synthetase
MIRSGAIFLNEKKIENEKYKLKENDLIEGKVALLRKGKKNYKLIIKEF